MPEGPEIRRAADKIEAVLKKQNGRENRIWAATAQKVCEAA